VDSDFTAPSTEIADAGTIGEDLNAKWLHLWARCKSGDIDSSVYETADALRSRCNIYVEESWMGL
jgi:hypothetical protein